MRPVEWAVEALRSGVVPGSPVAPNRAAQAARSPAPGFARSVSPELQSPGPGAPEMPAEAADAQQGEQEAADSQELIEDSQSYGEPYNEGPASPHSVSKGPRPHPGAQSASAFFLCYPAVLALPQHGAQF